MTIRTRLALLMSVALVLLLGALWFFRQSQQATMARITRNEEVSRRLLLDQITALKSLSLKTMVTDYTYWDDMVSFVKAPRDQWAAENIEESMKTFDVDVAWVYRVDASLVHVAARGDAPRLGQLPAPLPAVTTLFKTEKFPHFFVPLDGNLLEIFGATIHPTWDSERTSAPAGYFFLGRYWDAPYLKTLSGLVREEVALIPAFDDGPSLPEKSRPADGNRLAVSMPLPGYDGTVAAWLSSTSDSPYLARLDESFRSVFLAISLGTLILAAVATLAVGRWVNRPLAALTDGMKREATDGLARVRQERHEFGELARLMTDFFTQKKALENEIEEHRLAEEALRASEAKFNQIFENAPIGLMALDGRLHITHLNSAILKIFAYTRRELQNEHFSLLVHPDDIDACLQVYREMLAKKRLFNRALVRYTDKNGASIRGQQTDVTILDAQEQVIFLVSMVEVLETSARDGGRATSLRQPPSSSV